MLCRFRQSNAQQGAHDGDQFGFLHWLDEVGVGTKLETGNPVLGRGKGGRRLQHTNAGKPFFDDAAKLKPVHVGQFHVEHRHVGHMLFDMLECRRCGCHLGNVEAGAAQSADLQVAPGISLSSTTRTELVVTRLLRLYGPRPRPS